MGLPARVIDAAARHARPVDPVASSRLSVADAVRLAHHLVEDERVSVCRPPGRRGLDDAVLDQAGVLGEVWSWRADHVVRQASIR